MATQPPLGAYPLTHRLQPIATPVYLVSLVALVVNDLCLKTIWPGVITGKLSDVAGLFVFAVFFSCLLRRPALVSIITGVLFVCWKSPIADPLVMFWNAHVSVWPVSRVRDLSDLVAIAILPLAYRHSVSFRAVALERRFAGIAIAILSGLAFANTSVARYEFEVPSSDAAHQIEIPLTLDRVVTRLTECGYRPNSYSVPVEGGNVQQYLSICYRAKVLKPAREVCVSTTVHAQDQLTTLGVDRVQIFRGARGNEELVLADFRKRMHECFQ
ncbi:MAG: hypothetical protein ACJ74H_04180 [Thermoanaerobaculia bacterium]